MTDNQQTQFNKQQSSISRLRNIAVTIVPLSRRYRTPQMAGTIFRYRQYFHPKKHYYKKVPFKKNNKVSWHKLLSFKKF